MTRAEAIQSDTDFYAAWDDGTNLYGVFGTETGFCYATYAGLEDAQAEAETMRTNLTARRRVLK